MARIYALGAVKPWVKQAANELGNHFAVDTIYGVGSRETANSDHPKGLALDFMVGNDSAKGDQIAAALQQNYAQYNVTYVIWKQRIWSVSRASEGWRPMPDRGGATANHYDHVHASFASKIVIRDTGSGGIDLPGIDIPNPIEDVKKTLDGIKTAIDFATDSHNWLRVGMFAGGVALLLVALVLFSQGAGLGLSPAKAAKAVRKAVK